LRQLSGLRQVEQRSTARVARAGTPAYIAP